MTNEDEELPGKHRDGLRTLIIGVVTTQISVGVEHRRVYYMTSTNVGTKFNSRLFITVKPRPLTSYGP